MKEIFWKYILPVIIVGIVLGFILPQINKMLNYEIWDMIDPSNKEYQIDISYYLYIATSFILLGFTAIQTFIDKSHWAMKLIIMSMLIMFTLPVYITQSKFVITDNYNEKKQTENIQNNTNTVELLNKKINELRKKIDELEKIKIIKDKS